MLISLYERTRGPDWTNSTNWLVGDPCVGSWHGVWCCPKTHPVLVAWPGGGCRAEGSDEARYTHPAEASRRELQSAQGAAPGPEAEAEQQGARELEPSQRFPAGCASGNSSGTDADLAQCVVVALVLVDNNLRDRLDGVLDALPWLQVLELGDNRLEGPLPWPRTPGRAYMRALDLEGNRFDYDEDATPHDENVARLVALCRGGGISCSGMPPVSCSTFGDSYEVKISDPNQCIACQPLLRTALLFGALLMLMMLGLVFYITMILRNPEALTRWVSTTVIVIGHTQTLSILGLIRLGWPKSAEAVTDTLALDVVNVGGTKPECFLQAMDEEQRSKLEDHGGSAFVITVSRIGLVVLSLVGISLAQLAVKRWAALRAHRRRCEGEDSGGHSGARANALNDTLEFVETVVFSLQVTISVRASVQLMAAWDEGGWVGQMGGWVAVLACLLQVAFIAKYFLAVRTLKQKLRSDAGVRGALRSSPSFLPGRSICTRAKAMASRKNQARLVGGAASGAAADAAKCADREMSCGNRAEDSIDTGLAERSKHIAAGVAEFLHRLGQRWDRFTDWLDDRIGWSPGCRKMPPTRLVSRLKFIIDRYRKDKPYWQFVLWGRQTCLILAVSIPEMRGAALDEVPDDATLCAAAAVAIVVLAVFVVLQRRHAPYPYAFQNLLEVWLSCSSMLIVALGLIYAFVAAKSVVVEAVLLTVLIGSLVVSGVYLAYQHGRLHRAAHPPGEARDRAPVAPLGASSRAPSVMLISARRASSSAIGRASHLMSSRRGSRRGSAPGSPATPRNAPGSSVTTPRGLEHSSSAPSLAKHGSEPHLAGGGSSKTPQGSSRGSLARRLSSRVVSRRSSLGSSHDENSVKSPSARHGGTGAPRGGNMVKEERSITEHLQATRI